MQQYAVIRSFTKGGALFTQDDLDRAMPERSRRVLGTWSRPSGKRSRRSCERRGRARGRRAAGAAWNQGHLSVACSTAGTWRVCRASSATSRAPRPCSARRSPCSAARAAGPAPCSTAARTATSRLAGRVRASGAGVRLPRLAVRRPRRLLGRPGARRRHAADAPARRVPAFAARETQGFVWVWGRADAEPKGDPFHIPCMDDPRYVAVRRTFDFECTLHAALENALDVPHTAFLHRGRFRGGDPSELEAVRRRLPGGGLEVQYLGERRRPATPRLDRPPVEHWDRFFLPSVAHGVPGRRALAPDGDDPAHARPRPADARVLRAVHPAAAAEVAAALLRGAQGGPCPAAGPRRAARADRGDPPLRRRALRVDRAGPDGPRDLAHAEQAERGLAVDEDVPERRVRFLA